MSKNKKTSDKDSHSSTSSKGNSPQKDNLKKELGGARSVTGATTRRVTIDTARPPSPIASEKNDKEKGKKK